jgi:hypothetical protein
MRVGMLVRRGQCEAQGPLDIVVDWVRFATMTPVATAFPTLDARLS